MKKIFIHDKYNDEEMKTINEIPLIEILQRSVKNIVKLQEIKPSHDQTQKQITTTAQLNKPTTKKRGRKELQESNSPIDLHEIQKQITSGEITNHS